MPNFWTPVLQREFHEAVISLYGTNNEPADEVIYRNYTLKSKQQCGQTLRLDHELQIADHFAYLAHAREGVEAISAVCIEERDRGMLVRLASNHTPAKEVIRGLRMVLDHLSHGVSKGLSSRREGRTAISKTTQDRTEKHFGNNYSQMCCCYVRNESNSEFAQCGS
jgi:hypothetical protein